MLRDFLAAVALLGCAVAFLCASQHLEAALTTPKTAPKPTAATIAAR